ncbi:hypothetical protein CHARACLAT_003277 [Characodon lateralis]|uniref:T-cell surface glycoprotein CD3 zeta chain n=1 Tax=Characodon lateralis TaxID=208331 RepID=A0ABU7CKH9_9TELE|nr:hypothetical protein [Characodon lateralis]
MCMQSVLVCGRSVSLCVTWHSSSSPLPAPLHLDSAEEDASLRFCRCRTWSALKSCTNWGNWFEMELKTWVPGLLVLAGVLPSAEALSIADPQLCYILDGFLGLYGLIITGMFIKEKFFKTKVKGAEEPTYTGLRGQSADTYEPLMTDPERGGRNRRVAEDSTYTGLQKRTEPTYKELPIKKERQRKNEQVYQGLSSATRDTYDSLKMQPLPAR